MEILPNPNGINQLGSDRVPYGEAKRMKQLAGEAPMSGAPIATPALAAPQRARRNPQPRQQAPAPVPVPAVQGLPTVPQVSPQEIYSQISQIPGASPLVKSLFGGQS